ncbi:MAG: hypothetical protein JWP92_3752 [Caulobacter sp.]|nr:hypothetical protein [Caulobacter sp.]
MTADLNATIGAAKDAISGPGTPDTVVATTKADRLLLIAMAGAGPALCLMLGLVIWILADRKAPLAVSLASIDALKWIGLSLCGCLAVTVVRLASGQFKRADVKAGPASLSIGAD